MHFIVSVSAMINCKSRNKSVIKMENKNKSNGFFPACVVALLSLFLCEKWNLFSSYLKGVYRTLASLSQSVVELQVILQSCFILMFYSYATNIRLTIVNQDQAKTLIFVMYSQNNGFFYCNEQF